MVLELLYVEETFASNSSQIEDILCSTYDYDCLKFAINQLTEDEKELVHHIFFKGMTLKSFSDEKGICYSCAVKIKRFVLDKLLMYINIYVNPICSEKIICE